MCPTRTGRRVEGSVAAAGDPPVGEEERKGIKEVPAPAAPVGEKEGKIIKKNKIPKPSVPEAGDPPVGEIPKFRRGLPFTSDNVLTSDYDVFINHRGKDVKDTVASLVYHNLTYKGLKVFLDNKAMKHGDNIEDAIQCVIRRARVHIAIFSDNYAGSIWCLQELVSMLGTGSPIIPIFCGVQPRDLRERGIYSAAFKKHLDRGQDSRTVEIWEKTVKKVSETYGFVYEGDIGLLLENIAECVMKEIRRSRI